jgi:hypothetical protein
MPVHYDYDPKLNAVIMHLRGTVCKDEVINCLDRILEDDAVQAGHFQIVDFSTTDDYAVTEEDIAEIALKGEEVASAKGHSRSYYYADSDKAYGIARMLRALGEDVGYTAEVYRDWETMVTAIGVRAREATESSGNPSRVRVQAPPYGSQHQASSLR